MLLMRGGLLKQRASNTWNTYVKRIYAQDVKPMNAYETLTSKLRNIKLANTVFKGP